MVLGSERQTVQNPIIRYAQETDWEYLPPEEALRLRRGESGPIFWDIFIKQILRLNPDLIDHMRAEEVAKQLVRIPPTIEGNLQAWEYLRGLRTVFVEAEKRERNLRLVDFQDMEGTSGRSLNLFHVTDEFSFTNGKNTIRADVVFLLNGIPIILFETKAATKLEGIEIAFDQICRYHRETPEFMALTQIFGLTHLVQFYYGATWNLQVKNLFSWKADGYEFFKPVADFETLVKTFIQPSRVLRVLRDFILFTRKDDQLQKVVLRPHQMRAVERALKRCADPEKRRGLIWHTQGSGKTYTMIIIAKRLMEEEAFQNPTVLMLVDRNELETQLFGNLASTMGIGDIEVAQSKAHLRDLLKSDTRGLIVSMIHKFEDIPPNINTRRNIFVLVDEAHRTTGGDLGNYLMGALPNATYLGFTGTPIDKTAHGQGTFKVFGTDDPKGYLDKYSIAESIQDGTTVPLYYSLAPNELRVDREILDREFLSLVEAEGVSDIEDLNRILDRAVNLRNMLKNRERVKRVAEYVAKHYRETVEPMGFKAFLVGVDREACCLLKEALDQYLPPEYSQVVISPDYNDPPELARYHLPEEVEKQIRKRFRKPNELPKILIVTEKLLTGYDAPILYCMYLDKPMRDHALLQAIARVNRPYEDEEHNRHKPGGFVLDFVGIFENLERALAFDSQDVSGVIEDLNVLKERFQKQINYGRKEYLPLLAGKQPDKAADSALQAFVDEEKRQDFYSYFTELQDLYEIISPDPFLREYLEDYQKLADLYALLRAAFEAGVPTNRDLARKTALLVQERTEGGAIHEALEVFEITPKTLEQIAQRHQPQTVKVFNLLNSILKKVEEEGGKKPFLISIGERAEKIVEAFKQRQISTQEALSQLEEEIRKINEAEKEAVQSSLSTEGFTIFWILKEEGIGAEDCNRVASSMEEVLQAYPHWQRSERQARAVKQILYRHLIEIGAKREKEITEMVNRIMTIVGRRVKHA